jgi:inner membrane organizing system protein 1
MGLSNEILKQKWDKTLASLITTTSISLGIGLLSSVILFKRRLWPIGLSTGIGFGIEYEKARSTFDLNAVQFSSKIE